MLGMLGMPDYAHMIRQNLGTTYIAPEDGYIFTGGSSDDGYFNVYIDDSNFPHRKSSRLLENCIFQKINFSISLQ